MVRTHKLCNAQNTQSFHATTLTPDNFYFLNKFCTVHDIDTICTRFESAKENVKIRSDLDPYPKKKIRIQPDLDPNPKEVQNPSRLVSESGKKGQNPTGFGSTM